MTTEPKQAMPVEVPPSEEAAIEEQQSLLERDMEKAFTSRSCDWFRGWEAHEAVSRPQPPSTSAVEAAEDWARREFWKLRGFSPTESELRDSQYGKELRSYKESWLDGHARATAAKDLRIAKLREALELANDNLRSHSMQCKSKWIPSPDGFTGHTDDITGCVCHIRKIHEALTEDAGERREVENE